MTVTNYFWDPLQDNVTKEYDENGDTLVRYTTEPDLYGNLISQERDGVARYYHYDGQGSTLALTNKDGVVTDQYAYKAFGETSRESGPTENSRRFIGESGYHLDREVQCYYVRARVYVPNVARWNTQDPLRFLESSNLYKYVHNTPLVFTDPSGLKVIIFGWEGFGAAWGISNDVILDVYKPIAKHVLGTEGKDFVFHRRFQRVYPSQGGLIYSDARDVVKAAKEEVPVGCYPCYNRIVLIGYSAGGYTAAMVAAQAQYFCPRLRLMLSLRLIQFLALHLRNSGTNP